MKISLCSCLLGVAILCGLVSATAAADTGVGSIDASFSTTPDGAAVYSIPLKVPPGTNGLVPQLALSYNSRAGRSPFGFGWNVTGLSLISRGVLNKEDDGLVRGVKFDDKDALVLDGQPLVPVLDNRNAANAAERFVEYRNRVDNQTRVRAYDWTPTGPTRFVAETKTGLTLSFGSSPNSRVNTRSGEGPTAVWLCDRVEDRFTNYMEFRYLAQSQTSDNQIKEISYAGNRLLGKRPYAKLSFDYEDLATPYEMRMLEGVSTLSRKRLLRIQSTYQGEILRTYRPRFSTQTGMPESLFVLEELVEAGAPASTSAPATALAYPATRFTYTHSIPQWAQRPWLGAELVDLPDIGRVTEGFVPVVVRKDNKLRTAVVYRLALAGKEVSGAYYFDDGNSRWAKLEGGALSYVPPVATSNQAGRNTRIAFTDVDGDGTTDLIVTGYSANEDGTYIASEGGWKKGPAFPVPIRGGELEYSAVLSLRRGAGKARLFVWGGGPNGGGAVVWNSGSWDNSPLKPPHAIGDADGNLGFAWGVDADCDGVSELVYGSPGNARVYKAVGGKWDLMPADFHPPVADLPSRHAFQELGSDAAGCVRVLTAFQSDTEVVRRAAVASPAGWKPAAAPPEVVFVRSDVGATRAVASVVDIDGDGAADLVAHTREGQKYAYLWKSGGWRPALGFAPPTPLAAELSRRTRAFQVLSLGRPDGSARTALMLLGRRSQVTLPKIYLQGAGGGWQPSGQYALPSEVNIAVFDKLDLGVRFLDLNGDGYPDVVISVKKGTVVDSKAWLFQPTSPSQKWVSAPQFALPVAMATDDYKDTGVLLADVNGDGLVDVLSAVERFVLKPGTFEQEKIFDANVYINCSKKAPSCKADGGIWQKDIIPGLLPPKAFFREGFGNLGARAIDINGDGLTDLLFSNLLTRERPSKLSPDEAGNRGELKAVKKGPRGVAKPPGAQDEEEPEPPPPSPYELVSSVYINTQGTSWTEKADYAMPVPFVRQVHCSRAPGFNFNFGGPPPPPEPEACQHFHDDETYQGVQTIDTGVQFADVNADRLQDLIFHFRTFKQEWKEGKWQIVGGIEKGAFLNTGQGWAANPQFTPPQRIDADTSIFVPNSTQVFLEDLNGDGYPDLTYLTKGGSNVLLGSGIGWGAENVWYAIPDEAVGGGRGDSGLRFLDVNGDGLIDIVYSRAGGNWAGSGVFVNSGTGWLKGPAQLTPPVAFTEDGLSDAGVRPLDLNGDGLLDFIQFLSREGGGSDRTVWLNESGKPGLLSEVVTGLGYRVAVTYQSYLSFTPDRKFPARSDPEGGCGDVKSTCASQYPVIHALLPGYVVTRVETSGTGVERRSRAYSYAGYRVNTLSGRSLGFEFQDLLDEQRMQLTRSQYSQSDGVLGSLVAKSTTMLGQRSFAKSIVLAESRLTWEVNSTTGLPHPEALGSQAPKIFRSQLKAQSALSRDLHARVIAEQHDSFVHDASGRLKEAVTRFPNGASETVRTQYTADDVENWTLSRPSVVEREYRAPGLPVSKTRNRSDYLRDTYAAALEVILEGTPQEKRLVHAYDAFGNRTETRTIADGRQRIQKSTFDERGRLMRQVENAMGHRIDIEYEQKSGVVIARSTANGEFTRVEFDSLQRAFKETLPSGLVTYYNTGFVNRARSADTVFFTEKRVGSLPPEITLADALARTRKKLSYAVLDGPRQPCLEFAWVAVDPSLTAIVTEQTYDRLGRMTRATVPVRCGTAATAAKNIVYDELDRPEKITQPDQTTQTLAYEGLRTITTNALGHKTTVVRDIQGRNIEVIDAMSGKTSMRYDSRGRLVGTTDALGRVSVFGYDDAGNRTSVRDSVGEWSMKFTGFGELVSQADSRGSVIALEYDALGRLRAREAGGLRSVWVYDSCENGIGRLCSSSSSSGDAKTLAYDKPGRVVSAMVRVGADSILVTPRYDAQGRIVEKSYSTGQTVRNGYNLAGAMDKVSIVAAGSEIVLLEVRAFDETGRVRREILGGVERRTRFGTYSNRIESIHVGAQGLPALQSLDLRYDAVGNVVERADESVGWSERFSYDALNRITRAAAEGEQGVSVEYDAIGNITRRSDVGEYRYCIPSSPGQLCEVAGSRSIQLAYDAAGNVTSFGDLRLKFDAEGRVSSVAQGGDALRMSYSDFSYGADGQLLTHESRQFAVKTKLSLLDEMEVLRENFAPPLSSSPERTRVRLNIAGPAGVIGYYETTHYHHPYQIASPLYAYTMRLGKERVTDAKHGFFYILKDHLSSAVAVVDSLGKVTERFQFDPWGKRRQIDTRARYMSVSSGFTGHQHIDAFDLVHMGGRVYSALIGRFMSPDVMTQLALNSQSYNRYAYVLNNPMKLIDPTGFDFFGDLWDFVTKPFRWAGEQLDKVGRWVSANWKIIVIVAVAIAAPYAISALWGLTNAIAIGAITGAAVGATSGALYGGTIHDIVQGAAMGAITGAITGSVGHAYGESYGVSQPYSWGRVAAEGAAGGAVAHIRGGNFSQGFWFSAAMAAATYANQGMRKQVMEDSAQMDELGQNNLAPPFTHSEGKFGDGYKLGGERLPELGGVCGGVAGGCQITRGYLGRASWTYEAGSWQDNLVESYAGPHDWMSAPITYSSNGFQSARGIGAVPYLGTAASGVLLVPAAYFAMPAFIPVQVREEMRQRCSNAYGWCIY